MPTTQSSASQNKARPFVLKMVGLVARLAPALAAWLALRLFSTPRRTLALDPGVFEQAESWSISYAGRRLAIWRWRPPLSNGMRALLVHGWSGNAGQFARWIPAFTAVGYEVIAFDAPAHGASAGKRTHLVDFAGAIRMVAAMMGGADVVVAHSMGGSATIVAASEGLGAQRLVLISTPENVEARIDRFAGWLGLSSAVRRAMERRLSRQFGRPLRELRLTRLAPHLGVPVLVVHDAGDREIPWFEGARTAAALAQGTLHTVRGLGHTRVLREDGVIALAVGFLTGVAADRARMRDAQLEAYVEPFAAA